MSASERGRSKRVSPLRRRMIRDMDLAGLAAGTQRKYLRAVVDLVRYCGAKNPELITEEEVYGYILWLRDQQGVAKGTFQNRFFGLKFFFYRTLDRNWALFLKNGSLSRSRSVSRVRFPGMNVVA
jgi:hypothetical protein